MYVALVCIVSAYGRAINIFLNILMFVRTRALFKTRPACVNSHIFSCECEPAYICGRQAGLIQEISIILSSNHSKE